MLPPTFFRCAVGKDPRAADEPAQLLGDVLHLAVRKSRAPDEEDPHIAAQLMLQTAVRLAQEALRAAAHGGTAQFFPGGKADLSRDTRVAQDIEDHAPSRDRAPLLIDALKVAATLDHPAARQCISFLFHIRKKEVTCGDLLPKVQRYYAESFFLPR